MPVRFLRRCAPRMILPGRACHLHGMGERAASAAALHEHRAVLDFTVHGLCKRHSEGVSPALGLL
jgi:hypothetical protein